MRMAQTCCYSLGQAGSTAPGDGKEERFRNAEAARKVSSMVQLKNGIKSSRLAEELFEQMVKFAGVLFNQSHSLC